MHCHEYAWSADFMWAFATQACDFVVRVNFVKFQDSELDLLSLMFDLFGLCVSLLLALLRSTIKIRRYKYSRFFFKARSGKLHGRFERLPCEDQALFVCGNS